MRGRLVFLFVYNFLCVFNFCCEAEAYTGDLIAVYSHYDVEDSFLHGRTDDDAVDAVVKIRLQRCYRKEVACALCSLTRAWC